MAVTSVGLFQHPDCSRHDTGWQHPEHQGRLRAVMSALEKALPELHEYVEPLIATPASVEALELVHPKDHIERVRAVCDAARSSGELQRIDADTIASPASWDAALAAVGCAMDAVDAVLAGTHRTAFCPVRPPGHHATRDRAMGFCLFNNIAIAAAHAQRDAAVDQVLIVDWDVHHGNGTQDIFYEDATVFYLSMHEHPQYPGTGLADERGAGDGEGTTLNVPLPAGLEPERYVDAFLDAVDQTLSVFDPDLVLISAGFDAGVGDPLGGFTLTPDHFTTLADELIERSRGTAEGRVVSLLEGGYNPTELGQNVVAHLKALHAATT